MRHNYCGVPHVVGGMCPTSTIIGHRNIYEIVLSTAENIILRCFINQKSYCLLST